MTQEKPLCYVAHAVRGDVWGNIAKGKRIIGALTQRHPSKLFVAPWIYECEIFDDSNDEQRQAGLLRCMAFVRRCDQIWLCGERMSAGMQEEWSAAINSGKTIVDLIDYAPCSHNMTSLEGYKEWFYCCGGGREQSTKEGDT